MIDFKILTFLTLFAPVTRIFLDGVGAERAAAENCCMSVAISVNWNLGIIRSHFSCACTEKMRFSKGALQSQVDVRSAISILEMNLGTVIKLMIAYVTFTTVLNHVASSSNTATT